MRPEKNVLKPEWSLLLVVAIAMTVVYHATALHGSYEESMRRFRLLMDTTWIGIDILLFFGGFFATKSLLSQSPGLKTYSVFLGSRFLRFVVPYYLFLAVYLHSGNWFFNLLGVNWTVTEGFESSLWVFASNLPLAEGQLSGVALEGMFALSIGVQLLVVGALLLSLVRGRKILLTVIAVTEAIAILMRFVIPTPAGLTLYFFTLTRMDAFLMGMALAVVFSYPPARERLLRHRHLLLGLGAVALVALLNLTQWSLPYGSARWMSEIAYPILSLVIATVFVWIEGVRSVPTPLRLVSRLGKYTYGVFLWKIPMAYFCHLVLLHYFPGDTVLNMLVAILVTEVVTFGVAGLWYWAVERPVTWGLQRLTKKVLPVPREIA